MGNLSQHLIHYQDTILKKDLNELKLETKKKFDDLKKDLLEQMFKKWK